MFVFYQIFSCPCKGISDGFNVKETFPISLVSKSRQKEHFERSHRVSAEKKEELIPLRVNA